MINHEKIKMMKQLYALFVVLTLTLLLTSQAYSLWYGKLRANFSVSIGELDVRIGSYKIISCCHCSHECPETYSSSANLSPNGKRLTIIFENVYPEWKSYIGIVIANDGTLPAKLKSVNVNLIGDSEILDPFYYEVMYFGPYNEGDFARTVWSNIKCCDDLESLSGISPPITFYSSQKIIAWIELGIDENCTEENDALELKITLEYTGGW